EDVGAGLGTLDAHLDALRNVRGGDLEQETLGVELRGGTRRGLADEVHRDLDLNLLALAHDDEVEVLDDLAHRVLLHILDERQLRLALDVELKHLVRLADDERDLVTRQRDVLRLGAVTVDDGGNLARGADLARRALAEGIANLGDEVVAAVVSHGFLLSGPRPTCVYSTRTHR